MLFWCVMYCAMSVCVGVMVGRFFRLNDVVHLLSRGRVRNAITENADRFAAMADRIRTPTIVEFCWKCDNPRECRIVSRGCGTETLCNACGAQVDFDYDDDDWFDDDDDWCGDDYSEPIGSCEDCGTNLYPDDDIDLCDQCLWRHENFRG